MHETGLGQRSLVLVARWQRWSGHITLKHDGLLLRRWFDHEEVLHVQGSTRLETTRALAEKFLLVGDVQEREPAHRSIEWSRGDGGVHDVAAHVLDCQPTALAQLGGDLAVILLGGGGGGGGKWMGGMCVCMRACACL